MTKILVMLSEVEASLTMSDVNFTSHLEERFPGYARTNRSGHIAAILLKRQLVIPSAGVI